MIGETLGVSVIVAALEELAVNMLGILPKLILALIIWYIGKYLLGIAERLVRRFNLKNTKADDQAIATLGSMSDVGGKGVLALVILDYLGIGRTIISAIANGLTFAVAIALGMSFAKALEPDASHVVTTVKKFLGK